MEDISLLHDNTEIAGAEKSHSFAVYSMEKITEIYSRHIDTVYRICFSITGNRHDAEDAVQSVFLKMMKVTPSFTDPEHEKAWLIVTARNCCRDLLRQWWRRNTVTIQSTDETAFENNADNGDLLRQLMRLPQKQRLALYLHYYEGYRLTEIASVLKLSPNTVKSQIRGAKKRLKIELGDDLDE